MNNPELLYLHTVVLVGAAACSWGIIYLLLKTQAVNLFTDKPDDRKVHHVPIPRFGGVVIIATFLLFTAIIAVFNQISGLVPLPHVSILAAIAVVSISILIIGFLDDTPFVTIRVRHKLLVEIFVAASAVYVFNINIGALSIFGLFVLPLWLSNIVSFLWIIGLANAYNLIDGLDGLAGSLSLIAVGTLGIIAGIGGETSIVVVTVILSGAIVGFLIHNMPPAKTFMGDTGSLFLGMMIAMMSLFVGREVANEQAVVIMPLIAGVPILEVFLTMVRRFFKARDKGNRSAECLHQMLIPDNSHIHHRFTYRGYSPLQSTTILSMISFTLSAGAICCFLAPVAMMPLIIVYLMVPLMLILDRLGFGGRFKKALHLSPTRYNGYRKTPLIGIVDSNGTISNLLGKKSSDDIGYVDLSDMLIPDFPRQLHAAVIHNEIASEDAMQKAEKISSQLCRPVFIIEGTRTANLHIKAVSKNGSCRISEKTVPVRTLIKDFEHAATLQKISHHPAGSVLTSVCLEPDLKHVPLC